MLPQNNNFKKEDDLNKNNEQDIVYNKTLQIFFVVSLILMCIYIIFFLGLDNFNKL